jgi:hypothetical protein
LRNHARLTEQTALSLEWLNVDVARSKILFAESRRLLQIADAAAATAPFLSATNIGGTSPQEPPLSERP